MTAGASISSKFLLAFSNFSLGATYLLGDGIMLLVDMIVLLDLIQQTYWLQTQVKHLITHKNLKRLLPVGSSTLYQKLHAQGYITRSYWLGKFMDGPSLSETGRINMV